MSKDKPQTEKDARGQSESDHAGGSNDGITSADPRVISERGSGDATFPLDQDAGKSSRKS